MSAGFISISGISGVFCGIGLIYLSIRLTAWILSRTPAPNKEAAHE